MSFQAFPYTIPQGIFLDANSGHPTQDWWRFLLSLFNRTGAGDGIGPIVTTGLTAQGNSQANALLLAADWNEVDSVASGTGVVMPPLKPGLDITVFNGGGNALNVYPFSGASIDNGAVNAPALVTIGQLANFQCWTTTKMRTAYHNP